MSFYPPKINERFQRAKNVGAAKDANAVGTSATFVCGAVLRFSLHVDITTKQILEAKFKTSGCGYVVASAEWFAEKIEGKSLLELHSLDKDFFTSEMKREFGEISAERTHCFALAFDALQNALANFRRAQIEEWSGEKALICTCFGISEETIETEIREKHLATVEEVTAVCRAGGGCGSCQILIQEIIESNEFNW